MVLAQIRNPAWWLVALSAAVLGLDALALAGGASGRVLLALNAAALAGLTLYAVVCLRRRLHHHTREVEALVAVSQALSADQGIEALLHTVYEQAHSLLDTQDFVVTLCEGDTLRAPLVVRAGQVVQRPPGAFWPAGTLVDHVLQTRSPLLLERDVAAQARRLGLAAPDAPVCGWLGVPLLAGGRLLGALALSWDHPRRAPDREQVSVLNVIAAAAAAAIGNHQAYSQQAARVHQLATLNQVLNLLTETLSPDDVLDTVISSASAISEATAIAVYRHNRPESRPEMVRSAGLSDAFAAAPPLPLLTPGDAAGSPGQPVVIADAAHDARAAHVRSTLAREGKAAWVELPLVVAGHDLGVMIVYFDTPQTFSDEAVELLRTFANQAAQAIQNAELYAGTYRALEERVRQLSTLADVGRQMAATLDLHAVGQRTLDAALAATGATAGSVILLDENRAAPALHIHAGYPPGAFDQPDVVTSGITGRVLRTGQVVLRDDARSDADYRALAPRLCACLCVPVIWRGEAVGAITVESDRPAAFSSGHRAFLGQLANQVVIAAENARLFQRVREARDRMLVILQTMREPIILIDGQGVIAMANPRVDLIGLSAADLVGRSVRDLLTSPDMAAALGFNTARDLERLVRALRAAAAPLVTESYSYTVTRPDKDLYVQRQVIPVRDDDGVVIGVLLVYYNQTEQRELERAREEFARMIVHDLRSPLTAVTSSVMLLKEIVPPDNEYADVIGKTASASRRAIRKLLNRVDSLLDISRMQSGQMALEREPADLDVLVDAVWNQLGPLAQELGVALVDHVHTGAALLDIDADKVERVLLNLVDNALKFSPSGAQIVVRLHPAGQGGAAPGFCRVDVSDSGPGVPAEDRTYIFDRFAQLRGQRARRRGSGLGLTFCKLVVEAHGGRIWVEDNPGGGSVFSFTLPAATIDRGRRTEELPSSENQIRGLLLDDGD